MGIGAHKTIEQGIAMSWNTSSDHLDAIINGIELTEPETSVDSFESVPSVEPIAAPSKAFQAELDQLFIDSPSRARGREFSITIGQIHPHQRSQIYKNERASEWEIALKQTQRIFEQVRTEQSFQVNSLYRLVQQFLNIFSQDRNILLTLAQMPSSIHFNSAEHSMKTSIVALTIGTAMGYSEEQLVELGVCTLANDFGMLFMEPLVNQAGALDSESLLKLRSHPMISANIIEGVRGMPSMSSLVAYQVHERENGTGYPKQRQGRFIHDYAKIIAVADVFQAFCSPRAHRPAFKPYEAMTKIVGMVRIGSLSAEVVKSFMRYTSIYPVGSLVRLSDARLARVILAHENEVKHPTVSILRDEAGRNLKVNEVYQLDLRRNPQVQIVMALTESEYTFDKLDGL